MSATMFRMLPAGTTMSQASAGQNAQSYGGGIGFAVVDGQLAIAIKVDGQDTTVVATLHETVLDKFCGLFADHLAEAWPNAADLIRDREQWPTMQ